MVLQPHDPTADSAENAATYIVALVFTDSGHLRTTLVVTPVWRRSATRFRRRAARSQAVAGDDRLRSGWRWSRYLRFRQHRSAR